MESLFGADLSSVVFLVTHHDQQDDARNVDQASDERSQFVTEAAVIEHVGSQSTEITDLRQLWIPWLRVSGCLAPQLGHSSRYPC